MSGGEILEAPLAQFRIARHRADVPPDATFSYLTDARQQNYTFVEHKNLSFHK